MAQGGVFLGLFGLALVWRGLVRVAPSFDLKPIGERISGWLDDAPHRSRVAYMETARGSVCTAGANAQISFHVEAPATDLSVRVEALELDLKRAWREIDLIRRDIYERVNEVRQQLQEESTARQRSDEEHHRRLTRYAVGDWDFEMVGLIWIALGLLLSGWPA
jgi:hypothetical protein